MASEQNFNGIVYTVGHSNLSFEMFLEIINTINIKILIDVRSTPYSKYVPHFNKESLKIKINNVGIGYIHMGDRIGGKPKNHEYYQNGELNYIIYESSKKFNEGILNILKIVDQGTVIMCSEENPYKCHRHLLIAQNLLKRKFKVFHLRADKRLERAKMENNQQKLV